MRSFLLVTLAFLPLVNAFADTEPNNTWQTALALPPDRTVAGSQSDTDWYVINISSDKTVQRILIDLTFAHADGDIDMTLYSDDFVDTDADGAIPGINRTLLLDGDPSDHEFLDHNVSSYGSRPLYLKVSGENRGNGYTLTWTEVSGSDDGFEVNNDILDSAAITEGAIAFGVQADQDWYSIQVSSGSTKVLASLRFFNTQVDKRKDMDLRLHDAGGTELFVSARAAGLNEDIVWDVINPGTYYLQVSGDANGDGYALNWAGVSPTSSAVFPQPALNEAPSAIANTVSTAENTAYNFTVSDFSFSDSEGDVLVSATLTNLSLSGGTLAHSGGMPVNAADTLTAAQLDTLVYTPPVDSTGSPLATFDFTVNDLDAGTVAARMGINVTAVTTTPVTTTPVTSTSSGALAPAWLLVLLLIGILRRQWD